MTILYANDRVVATMPDPEDYIPPLWMRTRCRSCGASLASGQITCDYCETRRELKTDYDKITRCDIL